MKRSPRLIVTVVWSITLTVFPGILLVVPAGRAAEGRPAVSPALTPNHTPPVVEPFKIGPAFPSEPGPQDIYRARPFEEPLVPIGDEPGAAENAAFAHALQRYAKRSGPDDFSSLTEFLDAHPQSPWAAALLTDLGLDYYNTAHYSLALEAWKQAWAAANHPQDANGYAVANRALSELAYLYARLGRMTELEALLNSVGGSGLAGGSVKMSGAREALWMMKNRPEVSFRCGPLALQSIKRALNPQAPADMAIFNSASTQQGFSLPQVAELSRQVGLNYQMAFRESGGDFIVPSVVHLRVGHYAAIVRQVGDRYLVQDPTFGNTVWPTKQALEAETSGYFLIPPADLPPGWRSVRSKEGASIWGKGVTTDNDSDQITCRDLQTGTCGPGVCQGMAASSVHLMANNLQIRDTPLSYTPPVGPPVQFTVRYNQRDPRYASSGFGVNWTCDWFAWITDNPQSALADVKYQMGGGGARTFTGFDTNTQTFAFQQYDQTLLKRTGTNSYELLSPDGSKKIFAQPDGSIGTSRNVYLTEVLDPQGNALTFTYDTNLNLVAVVDAIGQVTTLSYGLPAFTNGTVSVAPDASKITRVTDPFGRSATFTYIPVETSFAIAGCPLGCSFSSIYGWWLHGITDVIGLTSQVAGQGIHVFENLNASGNGEVLLGQVVNSLITPYGTNTFTAGGGGTNNMRYVETHYPDGSRERVEYNQASNLGIPNSDPAASVPQGMNTYNTSLYARNTYYWSRNACAQAYGDYTKARVYHWLHNLNLTTTSGMLESSKQPLEGRVWYDYAGQPAPYSVAPLGRPHHIGRVLDDGSTQLYTYGYNGFGRVTNSVDPAGRTFSYAYATNGIDLLEVRMTRAGKNELLYSATYNSQHLPLTKTDAASQTNFYTYNARGQLLTRTDPKGETATCAYDTNGYLLAVDGPLPGTNDSVTVAYDGYGRINTETDVNGYTLTFDYDALDRPTRITHPDSSFEQIAYDRLDPKMLRDRAGRQTLYQYNSMRQVVKKTDALGRVTLADWCRCGALSSLTDPMGRTTSWQRDVQNRLVTKQYGDGSQITFRYENTTGRVRQIVDESLQRRMFAYNPDNTLASIGYANTAVSTPFVSFTYDPDYRRRASMSDGIGNTTYSYNPVGSLGASKIAAVNGPWPNESVAYFYDTLGLVTNRSINGITQTWARDPLGRVTNIVNALGSFAFSYPGASRRLRDVTFPGGMASHLDYFPNLGDLRLQQITHLRPDTALISQFTYGYDVIGNITNWTQQLGSSLESWTAGYDPADRLTNILVEIGGTNLVTTSYVYDPADNRIIEAINGMATNSYFNALNELVSKPGLTPTNLSYEWDGRHWLTAIVRGANRSEFAYDGHGRLVRTTEKIAGSVVSDRRWVWCGIRICEERDTNNAVVTRFFTLGEQRGGTNLYYFKDHLGSLRELMDGTPLIRAEYAFSPFGIKQRRQGDLESSFAFTGLLEHQPSAALFAVHRVYDPLTARWLSRDPLGERAGLNLFAYVTQNPLKWVDRLGYTGKYEDPSEDVDKAGKASGFTAGGLGLASQFHHFVPWFEYLEYIAKPLDVFESVVDVTLLIDQPSEERAYKAGESCISTLYTFTFPPGALASKLIDLILPEPEPPEPPVWGDFITPGAPQNPGGGLTDGDPDAA